jgi:tRNA (guanine37-N1)-methyltransferase
MWKLWKAWTIRMKVDILTIFPSMFDSLNQSIVGKAQEKGLLELHTHDFRENASNKQRHVDDMPYGGGQGMLLMPQPIYDTMDKIPHEKARVILLDPAGKRYNQKMAEELAQEEHLIFICGHYEGYDERIKDLVTDEISLGDFVLTGGEVAATVIVDSVVRLLPGALGKAASHEDDSFSSGLLEYPQYTRPEEFCGKKVPSVLMSGHHENIRKWRLTESLKKTLARRPDLLEQYETNAEEEEILKQLKMESEKS